MKYEYSNEQMAFLKEQARCRLGKLEGILFASGEPVPIENIAVALELTPEETEECITALAQAYASPERGIRLIRLNEGVQLVTKQSVYDAVKLALSREHRRTLSKAGYETLAITAYRQPVTRVEIDAVRGVNSSGAVQRLVDQGLLTECGRRDVPGHPYLYETTPLFLKLAGISSLDELPSYEEFAALQTQNTQLETVEEEHE